ncbi:MFS transporter [Microbacterium sp. Root166]|uniref:MFS transporter n=1 Tax=Microbacterium sp. Root166 TaxID=1736478 RepID=UPI0006F85F5C|nr:MFS transporter [Microbacterium sp. Root166]KQZ83145.1 MFS transporter [Microbacterium sp. Root166]
MTSASASVRPARLAPLYAAGFVTAFGAFSVAAGLGATGEEIGLSLLRIGVLLALYDVAEVLLKPVFGSLSDRIGAKPVIVGGLLAFAVLSLLGLGADNALLLAGARLGQGAAAAAFSPAASASVARLAGAGRAGRYFGRYGSWKGLGYTLGPLLAAALIAVGGLPLLFGVLSASAGAVAVWVAVALPAIPPLPRPRYTLVDLVKQTTDRRFLVPTIALATSTAVLGASVGFLPALATADGADLVSAVAIASVLAVTLTVVQPWLGGLRDRGLLSDRAGTVLGLCVTATGVLAAAMPWGPGGLYLAAVLIGAGIGLVTPFAFAALADSTPPERMGRTMGSAELGRELGDSAGPLVVGGVATVATLPIGLAVLAAIAVAVAVGVALTPAKAGPAPAG